MSKVRAHGKAKGTRAGAKLLRAAKEAQAFARGELEAEVHFPDEVDVKKIREAFNMTQAQFAKAFGFELGAIRNWEQGRRRPEGAARALLTVIAKEPEAVRRALSAA